jgi:hypothetical protein
MREAYRLTRKDGAPALTLTGIDPGVLTRMDPPHAV